METKTIVDSTSRIEVVVQRIQKQRVQSEWWVTKKALLPGVLRSGVVSVSGRSDLPE